MTIHNSGLVSEKNEKSILISNQQNNNTINNNIPNNINNNIPNINLITHQIFSHINNQTLSKSKALNVYNENFLKMINELKVKYKISDDPKAIKEFEAFYNNMLDKINTIKNNQLSSNNGNTNAPLSQNTNNTNPTQENLINVGIFLFF